MRVLHITNWYPSREEPDKVPFIKEHLMALRPLGHHVLVHVEIQDNSAFWWKSVKTLLSDWEHQRLIKTKKMPWRVKEWLSSGLLMKVLREFGANEQFDIVNIHTAYPLCSDIERIKSYLKIPLVFTEHWTAFQFNFGLPPQTKSLDRIRRIYRQRVPVITVSEALASDIRRFTGVNDLTCHVVPNVVRKEVFHYREAPTPVGPLPAGPVFFMVNYWRGIKSPFLIFDAFREVIRVFPVAKLRVGGYGPLWNEMKTYVQTHKLENHITLLGRLAKEEIAREMRGSTAFLHAAEHETFSVVTAEAIMCGTPVVVSDLPCIVEYIDKENGVLVSDSLAEWTNRICSIIGNREQYNREKISFNAGLKFSADAVGRRYQYVLNEVARKG